MLGDIRVTVSQKHTQALVYELAINDVPHRNFRIIQTLSIAYKSKTLERIYAV